MNAEKNTKVVKDFFAAINEGNKDSLLALLSPQVEWIIPGKDWPLAGTHKGHEGILNFFKKASEEVETSTEPKDFVAQGDRVLVIGDATGKIKATNKSFVDHWVFAFTLKNNKVTQIREYIDTQALARAAE